MRAAALLALSRALGGCSLGGLLGGGGKPPTTLQTLDAASTRSRSGRARGQCRTGGDDRHADGCQGTAHGSRSRADHADRHPICDGPSMGRHARSAVPEFVAETVRRTTNRVVLISRQSSLDPGLLVTGELQRFGYDASSWPGRRRLRRHRCPAAGRIESRRLHRCRSADGSGPG